MLRVASRVVYFLLVIVILLERIDCILDEGTQEVLSRSNWNLSFETFPATVVYAHSIADVVSCVRDPEECPSPVRAVGVMGSVTECVKADGGSLVDMSPLRRVLNYDTTTGIVTLQAGVTLKQLHEELLLQYDREISFQPEMGLATVGSLTVATAKDSSVNGPGYFDALVTSLKYVDHNGDVVYLDKHDDTVQFQEFLCSWGLMGIVVEVSLQTRPAQKILTRFAASHLGPSSNSFKSTANAHRAYKILQQARQRADNIMLVVSPQDGNVVVMERYALDTAPKQNWIHRQLNTFFLSAIQRVAFYTIQHGVPYSHVSLQFWNHKHLGLIDTKAKLLSFFVATEVVHHRSDLTNVYHPVNKQQDRLDFSLFFFSDESKLESIFKDTYDFTVQWHRQTGFAPSGFNMYFVQRTGETLCGMFSGPPGISWAMDPYHSNPEDPLWKDFVQALTTFNLKHGAIVSPTQSRFLQPEQFHFHQPLIERATTASSWTNNTTGTASTRFWTPFYQQFITGIN